MRLTLFLSLGAVLIGVDLSAATFIVPDDTEMTALADAIIVGRVELSRPEGRGRRVRTLSSIRIDEVIKGDLRAGDTIALAELGGATAEGILVIPGSPQYRPGERVLLFIDRTPKGEWRTLSLMLGKFEFDRGTLVRAEDHPIHGWSRDGREHKERARDEQKFLQYLRRAARGETPPMDYFVAADALTSADTAVSGSAAATTYPPSAYLNRLDAGSGSRPIRWASFGSGVGFRSYGSQSGASGGGVDAIRAGMGAWNNDASSNVNYTHAGTTTSTNGLDAYDTFNSVLFNDPTSSIPGSGPVGTLGMGGYWVSGQTHAYKNETFYTITYGDVVIQDGLSGWSGLTDGRFNQLLAHELGHTLGFRHSDAGTPATSQAIMSSSIIQNYGTTLQSYDRNAVATVYGTTTTPTPTPTSRRGDANGDGTVTSADVFYLINYLFASGAAPSNGDANGDGAVNTADVFYLISYLFAGGPAPPA